MCIIDAYSIIYIISLYKNSMSSWFMIICNYNSTHHPHHRHHCISLPVVDRLTATFPLKVVASRHCRIRCQHMWRRTGGWTTERHRAGMMYVSQTWRHDGHWWLIQSKALNSSIYKSMCVQEVPVKLETFRSHLPSINARFVVSSFRSTLLEIFSAPVGQQIEPGMAMLRPR